MEIQKVTSFILVSAKKSGWLSEAEALSVDHNFAEPSNTP